MRAATAVRPYRKALLALLLCIGFSPAAQGGSQATANSSEISLPAFEARLDEIAHRLTEIKSNPSEISKLRKSLPRDWAVQTREGTVQVSAEWLADELLMLEENSAKPDPVVRRIRQRLASMRAQAAELEKVSTRADTTAARTRLDEIFKGREYSGLRGPSEWDRFIARINRWIGEQLLRLFSHLHFKSSIGNIVVWIVIGLAFCALAYGIWRYLSGLTRASELQLEGQFVPPETRQWVRDALAAAERGDYREAVHCAYWAAIARLEALNLLAKDRARTPRESLRLMSSHPNEEVLLRDLTSHFELIWYGYRPASAADWSGARTQLEKIGCLTPSMPATVTS